MDKKNKTSEEEADEATGRFLRTIRTDPFLAVLIDSDGEVTIYSKGLDSKHLDRIRQVLLEEMKG